MKIIQELSDDIRCNIWEARDKIYRAYELKDSCPTASAWYKEMAAAHLAFNTNGHNAVAKAIADYKSSDAYRNNPQYADGMMGAWDAIHADLVKQTAEVKSMVDSLK